MKAPKPKKTKQNKNKNKNPKNKTKNQTQNQQTKKHLVCAIIAKIQNIVKESITNLSASGTFSPPTFFQFSMMRLRALPIPPS